MSPAWRWVPVRAAGARTVHHLVQPHWPITAKEARFDTACGNPEPTATVMDPDGTLKCLTCFRKAIGVDR